MKQLNKLSNPNKVKPYTYLCQLEVELKNSFETLNIMDSELKYCEYVRKELITRIN